MLKSFFGILLSMFVMQLHGQLGQVKHSFYLYDSVPVSKTGFLKSAFTGGFNSPQFINLDLNNDGTNDLLVFDRNDNKILPYLRSNGWVYSPQYEYTLPSGFYWYKTADLNSDGKPDIFTLTENGNLIIHLNITQAGDKTLKWKNLDAQYYRNQYPESFPILYNVLGLAKTDLPEIKDMDNDGDIDIVFYDPWNLSYSQFRDVRSEKGWPKDTWEFQLMDVCFGTFNEGFTNDFILGECAYKDKLKPRHVGGSSLVMFDGDEDGDLEMLVSNVGFKKMTYLKNGKAQSGSYYDTMIQVDSIYPKNTKRAADFLFPAGFLIDYDNDGVQDLVLAPNAFSDVKETDNIWLYRNTGKNNKPEFGFVTDKFLSNETVDVGAKSAPAFFDYDADGDQDLFIAGNGDFELSGGVKDRVHLYKNIGDRFRANYVYTDSNYMNLKAKGLSDLIVKFGDVDGDGDVDMYYGSITGKVGWYKNTAGKGKAASFVFASDDLLGNTVQSGMFNSAPVLYNYDNDTLPDMLVGMYNGRVALYVNYGTKAAPSYTQASTRAWGMRSNEWRTDVTPQGFISFGYAVPEVADVDKDGVDEVIIGTSFGGVRLYQPAGRSIYDSIAAVDGWLWQRRVGGDSASPDFGSRVAVAAADINNDSIPEFMFGTSRGGLYFAKTSFSQVASRKTFATIEKPVVYPNPSFGALHIDRKNTAEKWSISLMDLSGRVVKSSQILSGESTISLKTDNIAGGIYLLQVSNGMATHSERVVLMNR